MWHIAPENRPSQKTVHLPTVDFQGQAVSFREYTVVAIGHLFFSNTVLSILWYIYILHVDDFCGTCS